MFLNNARPFINKLRRSFLLNEVFWNRYLFIQMFFFSDTVKKSKGYRDPEENLKTKYAFRFITLKYFCIMRPNDIIFTDFSFHQLWN